MTKRKGARRTLTPAAIARQLHGAQPLAPGFWVDRAGDLHISVPDVLAHLGLPNTPAGIEAATETIRLALAAEVPDAEIIVQEKGPDG